MVGQMGFGENLPRQNPGMIRGQNPVCMIDPPPQWVHRRFTAEGHAMAGYIIFDVGPFDRDAMKPYLDKAFDTLDQYGGRVLVRTSDIDVREATNGPGWKPTRILLIEFASVDAARSWYESPEYQAILPIRLKHGKDNMVIVEGV